MLMRLVVVWLVRALDFAIVGYLAAFFLVHLGLIAAGFVVVRRAVRREMARPAARSQKSDFFPFVTLLVPAYDEAVTIVESLRSQLALRYPAYEIVICNDGSKDKTLDVLLEAFAFSPASVEAPGGLPTAEVRRVYECKGPLPASVKRLVLVDKENGGKADALNAAINLARGEFVTSMDADTVLVPDALLVAAQQILDEPGKVAAVGAQVGLSNGSIIERGKLVEHRVPERWIARFQVVEYMRSFAAGRTPLSSLNAVLILSGAFAMMRRDLVIVAGGFLTRRMKAKIGIEYCSRGAHTVCEDMEIVVRLHRYQLDKARPCKVVSLPFPLAWTEAPERWADLGKQRARWYRGLCEVLAYHRAAMFSPRMRLVGLFALPYQLLFEAVAPALECLGYVMLVTTSLWGGLSGAYLAAFLALAAAGNLCLSSLSVLLCVHTQRAGANLGGRALVPYARLRDAAVLLFAGLASNFGYRQYLVLWQLRGLCDFLKGKKTWDKFARRGFGPMAPPAELGA
jgi:cellulose synthase/poly-beta-1,6-N-acetylglucosamine synthase-like glycosyltransferase